jgi:hypothetical protein
MNNRQYPRTLEQAFGPYARGPVEPMRSKDYGNGWWWAMSIIAAFTVVIVVVTG